MQILLKNYEYIESGNRNMDAWFPGKPWQNTVVGQKKSDAILQLLNAVYYDGNKLFIFDWAKKADGIENSNEARASVKIKIIKMLAASVSSKTSIYVLRWRLCKQWH